MVSGIMLAVLKEQHADSIVLSDSTYVPLPEGLIVERITSGSFSTVVAMMVGEWWF